MNREAIYQALADRLATVPGLIGGCSRRLRPLSSVSASEQPAAFLVPEHEDATPQQSRPTIWRLKPVLVAYLRTDSDPELAPGTVCNAFLDQVETALRLQPGEEPAARWTTTLGGLVFRAWISGSVVIEDGAVSGQAVLLIPLELLTTAVGA